jgi:ribonuclease P protein component
VKKFTLGRKDRLKSRKKIDSLFAEGKKMLVSPFRVHYNIRSSTGENILQFGIGVSSKNFKKAVDRNRIKRLAREAYRLQKEDLRSKLQEKELELALFLVFTGKELPDYKLVSGKVKIILDKLSKQADENLPENS